MPINGIALTSVAAGSILLWSGIKGWNVSKFVGELITGKKPTGADEYALVDPNSAGGTSGGTIATSSGIANDAQKYVGHGYTYGGVPGKDGKSNWDCSSFVNWVVGHDSGRAIPGYSAGQYDGSVHGPATGQWIIWPGLQHIQQSQLAAGDLIVWPTHIGIAISNTQMISALNSQLGTKITGISGPESNSLAVFGRLK